MNFLAHIYLSGKNGDVKLGNFIGDWVKGRDYENYSEKIKEGILMHRDIDSYTDAHELIKASAEYFKPGYGRYSGIVIDIIFDYFLAKNWKQYHDTALQKYASNFYAMALANYKVLPHKVKKIIFKLILSNRLVSYQTFEGIMNAIRIMSEYTSLPAKDEFANKILRENEPALLKHFDVFFEDIKQYISSKYNVDYPLYTINRINL